MTDNLNRTVAAVRAIFAKYRGRLGKSGSLTFLSDRRGVFTLKKEALMTNEEVLILAMIEAGAADIESATDYLCITCPLETFGQVHNAK